MPYSLRDVPGEAATRAAVSGRYQRGQAAAASAADLHPSQDSASRRLGEATAARVDAQYNAEAELCYYTWREQNYIGREQEDVGVDVAYGLAGNPVYVSNGSALRIPKTYAQAVESPQRADWQAAMDVHLEMHTQLRTWEEVIKPQHQRALPCRWVYSVKTDEHGKVTKYKARTVIWGNMQREGIDFGATFSPTVRGEQVRLLIALGAQLYGSKIRQAGVIKDVTVIAINTILGVGDVRNAYLNSPLSEENVLTELPPGVTPTRFAPPGLKVLARQVKAHPGLRQAGRAWFKTISARLLERGYVQSAVAPCIFNKDMKDGGHLSLGIFVDDLVGLNATQDPHAFKGLADSLRDSFEVEVTKLDKFLGAQFDITDQGIRMHLSLYITGMLTRFEMDDCQPLNNPELQRGDAAEPPDETPLPSKGELKHYQEQVGALMYITTTCRPDIAHAVGMLARHMSAPRVCDTHAVKRLLRYLRGATDLGIIYRFETDADFPGLVAHCDADWAGDEHSRRSTGGYVVKYNNGAVAWASNLQQVVACSSCESEYIAASECGREVSYLRELVSFVNNPQPGPTLIYGDNAGAISLIEDPRAHKRTKHIEIKYHWVRVAQEKGVIKMMKIPTADNYSDIMTKATGTGIFSRHVGSLMTGAAAAAEPAAAVLAVEPAAAVLRQTGQARPRAVAAKRAAASVKPRGAKPSLKGDRRRSAASRG
jgi:hypothetical protein